MGDVGFIAHDLMTIFLERVILPPCYKLA